MGKFVPRRKSFVPTSFCRRATLRKLEKVAAVYEVSSAVSKETEVQRRTDLNIVSHDLRAV